MERFVGYVRVSTQEQAESGHSLDAQRRRIAAWCEAQGCELAEVYSDEGISGAVPPEDREGLKAALDAVSRYADGIIVLKLDRLSRSVVDMLELVDLARAQDFRLVSVTESLDTDSAAGRLVLSVLSVMSQFERELIGERTSAAMQELKAKGRGYSRFTPWGLRTECGQWEVPKGYEGKLIPHSIERDFATVIREWRGESAAGMAAHFRHVGSMHPRTGEPWTAENVRSVRRSIERQAS